MEMASDEVTFIADMRIEIGREYSLRVTNNGGNMSLKGTVVWSSIIGTIQGSEGDVMPKYKAILKVTDSPEDAVLKVEDLIRKEAENLGDEVWSVSVAEEMTAAADFPEVYRIKTINLGGMLIEASNRAEIERGQPMEIILPDGTPVKVQCRVANCCPVPGVSPERYDIGVEFVDMADQDRARFDTFIRRLDKQAAS